MHRRAKDAEFEIGEKVEGNYLGEAIWYPGTIGKYHDEGNGAYTILWADSSVSIVAVQYIRSLRDTLGTKRRIASDDMECRVVKSRKHNDDTCK